jgi:hypothetical protein
MPTGYRCGGIGTYTGSDSKDASIAWKVLDYEYRELDNTHLLAEVAKFMGMPATSWKSVIGAFRQKYGDQMGIWLTRSRKDAEELYSDYGKPEKREYNEKDVVSDLGSDGIYVLSGTTLSDLDTGYMDSDGNWVFYNKQVHSILGPKAKRGGLSKSKIDTSLRRVSK